MDCKKGQGSQEPILVCTEAFSVCHQCELQSRRGTFCLFCEEHTGQDICKEKDVFENDFCGGSNVFEKQLDLEPHTTQTEKKPNVKVHPAQKLDLVPGQTPFLPSHHAFAYDSSRMGGHVPSDGGRSSKDLDTDTTSSTLGGHEGEVQHDGGGHLGLPDETTQEGQPQKGQPPGVLGRPGHPPELQHDDCPVDELWEKEITQRFEPTETEYVGFGKHGNLTYAQIADQHSSYLTWATKEVQESDDPGWRLVRLVRWHAQQRAKNKVKGKTTAPMSPEMDTKSQGSFSMVSESPHMEEKAELEKMRMILNQKMLEVTEKEKELEKEKAEFDHTQNRHKNRKENQ